MAVGLEDMIVVNTHTALLIVHTSDIRKVKEIVKEIAKTDQNLSEELLLML